MARRVHAFTRIGCHAVHGMNAAHTPNDKLMWFVIIHLTFVLSALGMAFVDKMNKY